MYIVVNQRLRKYFPKDVYSSRQDPLGTTRRESDPEENIWTADAVICGRGVDKKMAVAMENARCGFRMLLNMPLQIENMEAEEFKAMMAGKIQRAIHEELSGFGIPQEKINVYLLQNFFDITLVKAKPSFPSQNVEEFAKEIQEMYKEGVSFNKLFQYDFNRSTRKFGICRDYRSVEMATFNMLGLTNEEVTQAIQKKLLS